MADVADLNIHIYANWDYVSVRSYNADHDTTCAPECNNTDPEHYNPGITSMLAFHKGRTYGYMHQMQEVAQAYQIYYIQQRLSRLGVDLTPEEAKSIDNTATKIAGTSIYSYSSALEHVINSVSQTSAYRALREQVHMFASGVSSTFDLTDRPDPYGFGPNYDHWWVGLERQCADTQNRRGRTNERGHKRSKRYSYGSPRTNKAENTAKQTNYWRHTTAR